MGGIEADERELQVPPVEDSETLLRLTWWPDDIDDEGALRPTAFVSQDLKGPERGVSVDRAGMAQREVMHALASHQQPKKAEVRLKAYVSPVGVAPVRAAIDSSGERAFVVQANPLPARHPLPANLAHALIRSRVKRSRSQVNELRLALIALFGRAVPLEDYFAGSGPGGG